MRDGREGRFVLGNNRGCQRRARSVAKNKKKETPKISKRGETMHDAIHG